jgi:hypothetical protein
MTRVSVPLRRQESAADLQVHFLVDSGRYPSVFDVMRDRYGITGVGGIQPPFSRLLRQSASMTNRGSDATHEVRLTPLSMGGSHGRDSPLAASARTQRGGGRDRAARPTGA